MRLRKIEAFQPTKSQVERQRPKKGLPKIAKFLIFILIMFSPVFIWKALTYNAVYANGIVMGQLELEMAGVEFSKITSGVDGEITELYAEKGQRVERESLLAVIKTEKNGEIGYVKVRSHGEEVIIEKNKKVGDFVKKGDVIYGVLPVGMYWVEAFVPERYINEVSIGEKAEVHTISPRKKLKGKIDSVSAEVETMPKMFSRYHFSPKRVFVARISLTDKNIPPGLLKFGMTVKCKIYKR